MRVHRGHVAGARAIVDDPVLDRREHQPQSRERRAQIVRDRCHEVAAGGVSRIAAPLLLRELLGHPIDGARKLSQLDGGSGADAYGPVAFADRLERVADIADLTHDSGRYHVGGAQRDERCTQRHRRHDQRVVVGDEHELGRGKNAEQDHPDRCAGHEVEPQRGGDATGCLSRGGAPPPGKRRPAP